MVGPPNGRSTCDKRSVDAPWPYSVDLVPNGTGALSRAGWTLFRHCPAGRAMAWSSSSGTAAKRRGASLRSASRVVPESGTVNCQQPLVAAEQGKPAGGDTERSQELTIGTQVDLLVDVYCADWRSPRIRSVSVDTAWFLRTRRDGSQRFTKWWHAHVVNNLFTLEWGNTGWHQAVRGRETERGRSGR